MSIGEFPGSLSRAILVGIVLVGRLGVLLGKGAEQLWRVTAQPEAARGHT